MIEEIKDIQETIVKYPNLNKTLLLKVAYYIENNWKELNMTIWRTKRITEIPIQDPHKVKFWGSWFHHPDEPIKKPKKLEGCISLHVVILGGGDINKNIPAQAQRLLGLDLTGMTKLVYTGRWPEPFHTEYKEISDEPSEYRETRAWITAERIRHFVTTNGME